MTDTPKKRPYGKRMAKGLPNYPRRQRPQHIVDAEKEQIRLERERKAEEKRLADEAREAELRKQIDPADPAWTQLALERIREDPLWWMGEYVYTYDQHDDEERVKKFPADKPHFKVLTDTILRDKVVYIVKSRQMTTSWYLSALSLWKALFFKHSECYVQCLNEKTVDYFVQNRMGVIFNNLPDWQKPPNTSFSFCNMKIPANGSFAEGVPSGKDKMRGRAPAFFCSDELAFQEEGKDAVTAVLPARGGDGIIVGNSTPNMRNFFHKMCFPEGEKPIEVIHPFPEYPQTRIERYKKHTVIILHYTADPDKRAKEWYEAERAEFFSAGHSEEAWDQEYELSFDRTGNPRLFPEYEPSIHSQEVKYNPYKPIIRGWDFGYGFPAIAFMQITDADQIVLLDAILYKDLDVEEFASEIMDYCKKNFKPAHDKTGRLVPIRYKDYCDPAGNQQKSTGNDIKIIRKHFKNPDGTKIGFVYRYSKPEERAKLIRHRLRVRPDGTPGMVVNKHSRWAVRGFMGGFEAKPSPLGEATGIPVKDGQYDNVLDAIGYPMENLFGVRKDGQEKERARRARRRRAKAERRYNEVTGYSQVYA